MDPLNTERIHAVVVDPALTRIEHDIIPALEHAVADQLAAAASQAAVIVAGALQALQGTADKAVGDLGALLAGLDGWTLEIAPITLRLKAPNHV